MLLRNISADVFGFLPNRRGILRRVLPLSAAVILMFSGCTVSVVGTDETTAEQSAAPYLTDDRPGKVYPVILGTSQGDVRVYHSQRLVCLSPELSEIVCEFGEISRIVGRCGYCDHPASIANVTNIGSGVMPDVNKIISLTPDAVLTSAPLPERMVAELKYNDITVVTIENPVNLAQFRDMYRKIGLILYGNEVGAVKGDEVFAPVARFCNNADVVSAGKFLYVTDGFRVAGSGTIENEILSCFGTNTAKSVSGYTTDTAEVALLNEQPDVIFVNDKYTAEDLARDGTLSQLTAVRNGNVVQLNGRLFERPTTRITLLLAGIRTARGLS